MKANVVTAPKGSASSQQVSGNGRAHSSAGIHRGRASPAFPAQELITFYADLLNDTEQLRISMENRRRQLLSSESWGKGVNPMLPEVSVLDSYIGQLRVVEHGVALNLKRAMRKHPLGPWCKQAMGVGEQQLARLLGVIGDPGSRRTVSQLWAYCGMHVVVPGGQGRHGTQTTSVPGDHVSPDTQTLRVSGDHLSPDTQDPRVPGVAPSRRKGQRANWNMEARSRVRLIAESCMKAGGPYRVVYDAGREKYVEAVHTSPCPQCGASGPPHPIGSPLRDGHKHSRALRLVAKAILRDLWVESRRVSGDHSTPETQITSVSGDHHLPDPHSSCVPGDHLSLDTQTLNVPEGTST